jgi:hypothetical protein
MGDANGDDLNGVKDNSESIWSIKVKVRISDSEWMFPGIIMIVCNLGGVEIMSLSLRLSKVSSIIKERPDEVLVDNVMSFFWMVDSDEPTPTS